MNDKRQPFAIQTILALPWRIVHLSLRWLGGGIGLLLCLVGAGVAAHVGKMDGWRYGIMWYAFGMGYFWMCVMACLLLVAIDARRQCLPGAQRVIAGSVMVYALVSEPVNFSPSRAASAIMLVTATRGMTHGSFG